jgi:5-methylcytosine-specific restriction endonuclease McrA
VFVSAGAGAALGFDTQVHHKLTRSKGGKHTMWNLIAVTQSCHETIHANPAASYAKGLLLRSGMDWTEDREEPLHDYTTDLY